MTSLRVPSPPRSDASRASVPLLAIVLLTLAAPAAAQSPALAPGAQPSEKSTSSLRPDGLALPFTALRFGRDEATHPSWRGALELSTAPSLFSHWALARVSDDWRPFPRELLRGLGAAVVDAGLLYFAGLWGWAHEEGHRAVLGRHGLASHNGVIDPPGSWPSSYRPVYGLTDEALGDLKRGHPADFVRLQAAGWETELGEAVRVQQTGFFYALPASSAVGYVLFKRLSVVSYLSACLDQREMTRLFEDEVEATGTDVHRRDFTGPDCTGWVYDLHRPEEPYDARGPHPSGVGLRRDRLPSDLTSEERSRLTRERNLSLLNFADARLLGWESFGGPVWRGVPLRWTTSLAHTLTAFGSTSELNLWMRGGELRLATALQLHRNRERAWPGVRAALERWPVSVGGRTLRVGGSLGLWLQPDGLRFDTRAARPGVQAEGTLSWPLASMVELDARLGGKSTGWVAYDPNLRPAWDAHLGVTVLFPAN